MTTTKYNNPPVGCYVDASAQSADYLNERIIGEAESYGFTHDPLPDDESEDYSEILNETADSAVDYLNELETRSFMFWVVEDNSLFLSVDVDGAREDVGFVSHADDNHTDECDPDDASYPDADYRGEWLHISDHGNATLYVRGENGQDKEIWGVV